MPGEGRGGGEIREHSPALGQLTWPLSAAVTPDCELWPLIGFRFVFADRSLESLQTHRRPAGGWPTQIDI